MRITPLLLVLLLASPVLADEPKAHRGQAYADAKNKRQMLDVYILHVADHPETRGQSQRLVKALQEAGISATAYPAEGKNHTTINNDLGLSGDRPTQEMFGFLSMVLKK